MNDLIKIQIDIEEQCARQGYDVYMNMVNDGINRGRESTSAYGIKLMNELINQFEVSYAHYFENQSKLRRKNKAYLHLFKDLSETRNDIGSVLAFLLAQVISDNISGRVYLTSATTTLLKKLVRSFGIDELDEETESDVITGLIQLVRFLVCSVEYLNIDIEPRKRVKGVMTGGKAFISVDETKAAELKKIAERIALNNAFHRPMIVKPVKHTSLVSPKGGYLNLRSPLLKSPVKVNGKIHPMILGFKDKEFFDTLNAHQEVGYKINKQMIDIIKELQFIGAVGDSLHYNTDILRDEMMANAAQEIHDVNEMRKENFGANAFLLTDIGEQEIIKKHLKIAEQYVASFKKTIAIAQEYSQYDAFYYPVFLDNRGRIYYYGKDLNPQGNELHRSLLQFAEGTVMDDIKVMDSYIALGNAMGYDKKTIEFRQNAVIDNLDTFVNGSLQEVIELLDKDALLTGLAVAMDIRGYHKAKAQGQEYISYQPLHFDSCNSGSQINGVLLRDDRNCRLSNIINVEGDTLEDTYKAVALDLQRKLLKDQSGMFRKFNNTPEIYHRTVFKKSSMVRTNYGGSHLTCRDDISYQLKKMFPEFWNSITKSEKDAFMVEAVRVIDASLPASTAYKRFARKMIAEVVKRDECLAYHNPRSGFPVVLRENVVGTKDIKYTEMFTGKCKSYTMKIHTKDVDRGRTVSASVPGITHSFDAGIIIDVKKRCGDIPMTTIHDSIAVLAGHGTSKLLPAIRDCYYDMAVNDDLRVIADELKSTVEIPYSNDLDIEEIKVSKHLYS